MKVVTLRENWSLDDAGRVLHFLAPPSGWKPNDKGAARLTLDRIYLIPDNMESVYRKRFVQLGMKGLPIPPKWSRKQAEKSEKKRIRLLVINGTGSGWGDVLSGTLAFDEIKAHFRKLGKEIEIGVLVRDDCWPRYSSIYKLKSSLDRLYPVAIPLSLLTEYDYIAETEAILLDKHFYRMNMNDYWLWRLDMNYKRAEKNLHIAGNPKIADPLAEALQNVEKPFALVAFLASKLRHIPVGKWKEIVDALTPHFTVGIVAADYNMHRIKEWFAANPGTGAYDLTHISSQSFDHLVYLAQKAAVIVTPDTSLLHIAGALGKPTVGIFFTVPPDLRIRYMPSVTPYVPKAWTKSKYWQRSKVVGQLGAEQETLEMNPEVLTLWEHASGKEIAELARKAKPARSGLTVPSWSKRKHPRILVLGRESNCYADRVRRIMLQTVLPVDAEVEYVPIRPLEFRPLPRYDLLIVGNGDSITEADLRQSGLQDYVAAARASIGIFGTAYRDSIDFGLMRSLVDSLDVWFARAASDVDLYMRGTHLGDWTILFPSLAQWRHPEVYQIGIKEAHAIPADAIVSSVQKFRAVLTDCPVLLATAACSAEEVQYTEAIMHRGQPAGECGSFAEDLCGKRHPPGKWWPIKRAQVIAYRERVAKAVDTLRAKIREAVA